MKKPPEENDDGLGLFADVISGTLGIIMLTALFFALRAINAADGVAGLPEDPALRDELSARRLDAARARVAEVDTQLTSTRRSLGIDPGENLAPGVEVPAADPDLPALVWSAAQDPADLPAEEPAIAAARLRDRVRQRERLVDLQVLQTAADSLASSYRVRLHNAREEFIAKVAAGAAPLRQPRETAAGEARWFYVLVRGGHAHPLYVVKNGRVDRDTERNSWITHDGGRRLRCFPREGAHWPEEETASRLRTSAREAGAAGWQVVLLIHPDSFPLGRELVRLLDGEGVRHSWRPWLEQGHVSLALDGLRPPGARE